MFVPSSYLIQHFLERVREEGRLRVEAARRSAALLLPELGAVRVAARPQSGEPSEEGVDPRGEERRRAWSLARCGRELDERVGRRTPQLIGELWKQPRGEPLDRLRRSLALRVPLIVLLRDSAARQVEEPAGHIERGEGLIEQASDRIASLLELRRGLGVWIE